jgi:hypothetical protein
MEEIPYSPTYVLNYPFVPNKPFKYKGEMRRTFYSKATQTQNIF